MASQLKSLMSFLTVSPLLSGVGCKTKSRFTGLYIVKKKKKELIGVWWNAGGLFHVTHYVAKDSFRAIYYKWDRRLDKSIFIPKLSALQQRCLRFLLLLKWIWLLWTEIQYSFEIQRGFFKKYGAKSQKSTNRIKKEKNLQTTPTARSTKVPVDPNAWYIYLHLLV